MPKRTILIVSISQIISYLIPLITFPILVKSFDLTTYGIWIEASTISSLAVSFGIAGLANAMGVMIVNKAEDSETIYVNSLYLFMSIGIGLTAIIWIGSPLLNSLTIRNPLGIPILQIVAIIPFINTLQTLCIQIFRLQQKPFIGSSLEIIMVVARLMAALFAAVTRDLLSFALIYVLLQTIAVLPFMVIAFRKMRLLKPSWPILKETSKHTVNLSLTSQSLWLIQYGDRLMLSVLSLSSAVAIYSASYQLCMILVALGWPYLYALLPILGQKWTAGDIEGLQNAVKQSTRSMALLLIPAIVGLTATGSTLLKVLATDNFVQGTLLVAMITVGIGIDTVGACLQYIFYAQGRPYILRNIYLRAAIFNIVANLIAIPLFSYNGAGLTTLLTFAYTFYALWRKTDMPFNTLFDINAMWRCLIASVIMGVWVLAVVQPTIIGLTAAIGGGAIIYGIGIIALKVISLDELLAVWRSLIARIRLPKTA